MKDADARALLRDLFDAALAAARPATCLAPLYRRAAAAERQDHRRSAPARRALRWRALSRSSGRIAVEGLVVTRYGYGEACRRIEIVEAAHPVPDEKGRAAAGRILERVQGLTRDDLVLCLISGGASALLALPAPGLTPRRQAGGQSRVVAIGRQHRRDEHGAKAPLGHQGRPPRRSPPSRRAC